ncbi:Asp23/Gls24 family envelope stress response protein [Lapillicoccus jejuensis]|uniref:Putative alkaline shock family protein YloU n=1 Tax=Lapillicoccus jejuensis TaxID=402171 RepID=A0A542DZ20_9MICO|nr:Asp23/Gls24 family envelope stress response protein [Lapillicoccus jejuensis]TQJ08335.1 putative alkaline shock family protein YloU [Lapillicoccus jejuensis]
MSDTTKTTAPTTPATTHTTGSTTVAQTSGEKGKTTIADTVVSKIAGIATREVDGVYDLGGNVQRAVGLLRERIPVGSTNLSQGVSVEVGEKQAAVDLTIIAEYGVGIADLASGIRRNVIASVERMTGLQVTEVNIAVSDVHIEDDDAPATAAARELSKDDEPAERRVQ